MVKYLKLAFFALLLSLAMPAIAIDTNSNLPIDIESDQASIDDAKGISTYSGNVIISQGLSKIEADHIIVKAANRELVTIEALGTPAHFIQQDDADTGATHGYAKTILYTVKASTLSFVGDASLIQAKNSFSGDKIIYDIAQKAIMAKGNVEAGSRVKIQYHPRAESDSTTNTDTTESTLNQPGQSNQSQPASNQPDLTQPETSSN